MNKLITIKNGAVQYGDLGQLSLDNVILSVDDMYMVRGSTALEFMLHGMNQHHNGSCPSECKVCTSLSS